MDSKVRSSSRHAVGICGALVIVVLVSVLAGTFPARADGDAGAIRALIGATWDKPDAKVETDPVVVVGGYAVASWIQGPRGGRALLRREGGVWSVLLCSGDALKEAASLVTMGVPENEAKELAGRLAEAEASVDPKRRAMFALFGNISPAGADDAPHGPRHGHH